MTTFRLPGDDKTGYFVPRFIPPTEIAISDEVARVERAILTQISKGLTAPKLSRLIGDGFEHETALLCQVLIYELQLLLDEIRRRYFNTHLDATEHDMDVARLSALDLLVTRCHKQRLLDGAYVDENPSPDDTTPLGDVVGTLVIGHGDETSVRLLGSIAQDTAFRARLRREQAVLDKTDFETAIHHWLVVEYLLSHPAKPSDVSEIVERLEDIFTLGLRFFNERTGRLALVAGVARAMRDEYAAEMQRQKEGRV